MDKIAYYIYAYANEQNYKYNNIAKSIWLWRKIEKNKSFSVHIRYHARLALMTQYRFLLYTLPILQTFIDEYDEKNKQYRKMYKESERLLYKTNRCDHSKVFATKDDIKNMKEDIIISIFTTHKGSFV